MLIPVALHWIHCSHLSRYGGGGCAQSSLIDPKKNSVYIVGEKKLAL